MLVSLPLVSLLAAPGLAIVTTTKFDLTHNRVTPLACSPNVHLFLFSCTLEADCFLDTPLL
jgi:hypothetical protein